MYDTILVPTDRDIDTATVDYAIELARSTGATLHILYVVEAAVADAARTASTVGSWQGREALREVGQEVTETIVSRAANTNVKAISAVLEGEPEEEIVKYAADFDIDIIVIGSQGSTAVERALMGSVTERVARLADRPVLIIKGADTE